jgi:uncharacterized protein (TIGR02145 family)
MKSTSGWNEDGNGNNTSGFAGLPGGYRNNDGDFSYIGAYGYWWSSSEYFTLDAWYRGLSSSNGYVSGASYDKLDGFSVRCLRD